MIKSNYSLEEIEKWAKEIVRQWHDKIHPDYVFLAETSATPNGWLLKETWRRAYPGEKPPSFYRIDPMTRYPRENSKIEDKEIERTKEYFKRRIKKDDATIVVLDDGLGHESPKHTLVYEKGFPTQQLGKGDSINIIGSYLTQIYGHQPYYPSPKEMPKLTSFKEGKIYLTEGPRFLDADMKPTSKLFGRRKSHRDPTEDEAQIDRTIDKKEFAKTSYTLAGRTVRHPEQKKRAKEFIKNIKKVGREAGEELHQELHRNDLEQRLSAFIGIGSLILSLSFFSTALTGNIIGSMTNSTSNILGTLLFLVGILGVFFYFRKK